MHARFGLKKLPVKRNNYNGLRLIILQQKLQKPSTGKHLPRLLTVPESKWSLYKFSEAFFWEIK